MKRMLIDAKGEAVRTAILTDGTLRELFIDRKTDGSLVGRIILGTVRNILPSLFAFIDIGREKNAFMNISPSHALKVGQPVLVQVYKDASGSKGANVGERLNLNGRLAILFEGTHGEIGVSHKITAKDERDRLRSIAKKALPPGYGLILRTNSEGKMEEEIRAEIGHLEELHRTIKERARHAKPPAILHRENPLLNDLLSDDTGEIWVNDPEEYAAVRQFIETSAPVLIDRVHLHDESAGSLFSLHGVERQITRALERNVWLPCGGFVTFEQTEACVIVDVNTGKFAGRKNYRETVLQTNLEAAACVADQIALRNLSGMIIVDFIDMYVEEDKRTLVHSFSEMIKKDRIKTAIVGMTELGLVQLTRRKTRESLSCLLECACPHCGGTGRVRRF